MNHHTPPSLLRPDPLRLAILLCLFAPPALQASEGTHIPGTLQRDHPLRIGGGGLCVGGSYLFGSDGLRRISGNRCGSHRKSQHQGQSEFGTSDLHWNLQSNQKLTATSRPKVRGSLKMPLWPSAALLIL